MTTPKRPEDLPALTDDQREALDGYTEMAGVPEGDEPPYTKGSWEAEYRTDRSSEPGYWVVIGDVMPDRAGPVADTMNRHHCILPEEDEANARLIAASPRLLKALKDLLVECERLGFADVSLDHPMVKPFFDAAHTAIDAAEGKS